jgi:[acyl-carrier-protein] S-malonyltransferase
MPVAVNNSMQMYTNMEAKLLVALTSAPTFVLFFRVMRLCFLFPGQGAQYPGMGKDLLESSQEARDLCERASKASGVDLDRMLREGTAEELASTDRSQIAITLVNIAAAALLRRRGVAPDGCAGFSLGEYAALAEAGVLAVEDLFRVVKARGEIMERVSRSLDAAGGAAGMAAVIGLAPERIAGLVGGEVYLANQNSPTQAVLSGTARGLAAAEEPLKRAGARRVIRLKVSGPFHCPLMEEARRQFAEVVSGVDFADPKVPVYSNATAGRVRTGAEARELCVRQLVSPVRWMDEERRLLSDGFDRFLEVGPGTVLAGLLKALEPAAACAPAGKLAEIEAAGGGG